MPAPVALSPATPFDYVLKGNADDPEDQQVTFECVTLTGRQRLRVQGVMTKGLKAGNPENWEPSGEDIGAVAEQALLYGLAGWRGLKDAKGREIPWPGSAAQGMDLLDELSAQEVGTEIWVRSRLGDEEKKD